LFRTNAIYCGDCQRILRDFPEECVDLIYVDPPFFSNKQYEILWGNGYELRSFEDRWQGDILNYIAWMEPKIRESHRVLKDTGSIYLHCDWHANAHLRILMDKIFGENHFLNEIIWSRTHAHGGGEKGFSRIHDTLLFYVKSDSFRFNRQHVPYSAKYIKNFFRYVDKDGRRYRLVIATGSGETKSDYLWKGVRPTKGRHWAYTKEKMEELDKQGKLVYSQSGMPSVKQYIDEKKGTLVTDIWTDIEVIHSQSKERLGYPTQKPERLLDRIIKASSNPMDIVLDPMCGGGTTIAVAHKLGRRWIGIDVSPVACKLMVERMRGLKIRITEGDIVGLPKTIEEIKALQPFEFQNWVIQKMYARASLRRVGDMGVDGWTFDGNPIQIKQSEDVGRNVIDNFETAMRRANKKKGIIVAFSFGKGAYEEVARAKLENGLEIELKKVEDIIKEI